MNDDREQEEQKDDDLLPEYDFSQGVRGKHFREYQQGYTVTITHPDGTQTVKEVTPDPVVIVLDPDVQRYFPDSEAVNRTLRSLLDLIPAELREASVTE
jgi:hypothetical protein